MKSYCLPVVQKQMSEVLVKAYLKKNIMKIPEDKKQIEKEDTRCI